MPELQEASAGPIPNVHEAANIPKKDKRSAAKISEFLWRNYQDALHFRRAHAATWVKVRSIMNDIHYFTLTRTGQWIPKPKERGTIRAQVPLMRPMFRNEHGRIVSNNLGVTTVAANGDSTSLHKADRAYNILTHWIEEVQLEDQFDTAMQLLVQDGLVGLHWYKDEFAQTVKVRSLSAPELFPVPFNARTMEEADGLSHITIVSESWLEQQDQLFEQNTGQPPPKRMVDAADKWPTSMSVTFPTMGVGTSFKGPSHRKGAVAVTTWMKPSPTVPSGEYIFMLGKEVYRYRADRINPNFVFPNGRIPVEIISYTKQSDSFWANGFCEELIAPQMSINRSITNYERSVAENRTKDYYDADSIDTKDQQNQHSSQIKFQSTRLGAGQRRPAWRLPAGQVGSDAGAIYGIMNQIAQSAVGYNSSVITGQAEGRVESNAAISTLNSNAQAPIVAVFKRISRGYGRMYGPVLDLLREVWPNEKTLQVSGTDNIGKEIMILKDQMPWSREVIIHPTPMLPNGTSQLASVLMQLKTSVPGDDGRPGSLVPDEDFLRSIRILGLKPPGMQEEDTPTTRMQRRINKLIGDQQQPRIAPADPADPNDRMGLEDHRIAVDLLRKAILHDSWEMYGPAVQQALVTEFRFHWQKTNEGAQAPGTFGTEIEEYDALVMEDFLFAAEQDLSSNEGQVSFLGQQV